MTTQPDHTTQEYGADLQRSISEDHRHEPGIRGAKVDMVLYDEAQYFESVVRGCETDGRTL